MDDRHERLMAEALAHAAQAIGRTRPNPLVGCVIVRDGALLADGYHHRAGEAHAEVDALRKLAPGEAAGADLYVNLEPCSTHGRTPPCTDAIIEAGIARVFVATLDSNPRHRGIGIDALRAAGVEVVVGVGEEAARKLNAPYFCTMERGRPLVIAKWAMSLDGKIATRDDDSAWITNEASRRRVHELRNAYDAVMVGTRTLLHDDPRLTCRIEGGRDPLRVVLDPRLEAPETLAVFAQDGTIVLHAANVDPTDYLSTRPVRPMAVEVDDDGRLRLEGALRRLRELDVMSVLVEGGGELLGSLFDAGLVDRVYAFVAPRIIGGRDAVPAVGGRGVALIEAALKLTDVEIERHGEDTLIAGDIARCSPD